MVGCFWEKHGGEARQRDRGQVLQSAVEKNKRKGGRGPPSPSAVQIHEEMELICNAVPF